jgi:O-antigen/teichoic acid export membrane protein
VTRAVGGAGSQLGIGAVAPSPFGLIFGQVVYSGLGILGLARPLWRDDRGQMRSAVRAGLSQTASRFRAFPLFSVPEALFNAAGTELSILIIAAVAAGPEAGFLMLAMRVLGLPMGLVGSSVGQVYLAEAGERLRKGELSAFTWQTMRTLFRAGAPLLLLAGIVSPFAFPYVFGAEWARAGVIVAWLTPMFILQLVASPVSMAPHVVGKVAWAMWLQLAGGILRVGAVACAAWAQPSLIVEVFAISSVLFYVLAILLIQIVIRRTPQS